MPSQTPALFFSAFEPSGDALAAPLIRRLRELEPDRPIYAFGGPRMEQAGAQIIEITTENAVMLGGVLLQVTAHWKRLRRLDKWLAEHPVAMHIPVDSPAANWSISGLIRKRQPDVKVVHLVAPQVWAWATWRMRRLRRLTNQVLCIMPFETDFLGRFNIPAAFVGHPLVETITPDDQPPRPFTGDTRIALLPGSRIAEIEKNWPSMLASLRELQKKHPNVQARVAAISPRAAAMVRRIAQVQTASRHWSDGFEIVTGQTSATLDWADVVLVVSGTASFEVAAHRKPMVVLFRVKPIQWYFFGRFVVNTKTFSLPNLIGESMGLSRVVPELVPLIGPHDPVAQALETLVTDDAFRLEQWENLGKILAPFRGVNFIETSARQILDHAPPLSTSTSPPHFPPTSPPTSPPSQTSPTLPT